MAFGWERELTQTVDCVCRLRSKDPIVKPPHASCPLTNEATWGKPRPASGVLWLGKAPRVEPQPVGSEHAGGP